MRRFFLYGLSLVILCANILHSDERLAKHHLIKAYENYQQDKNGLALELLQKSYSYTNILPEYYYLSNLLIDNKRENLYIKHNNCNNIYKNIGNNFFISDYMLLTHIADIYREVREYDKLDTIYQRIFLLENIDLLEDYKKYINTLILSNRLSSVEKMLNTARQKYYSIDFVYFDILYKLKTKRYTPKSFYEEIAFIEANSYSKTAILYLKSIFEDDKNILKIYDEYKKLSEQNQIEPGYKKNILSQIIEKSSRAKKNIITEMLNEWIKINGLSFIETNRILNNKILNKIITDDKNLNISFLKFTGIRIVDEDNNGNWEEYLEYKDGNIIYHAIDKNQDGVIEIAYGYNQTGSLAFADIYITPFIYEKSIFNVIDGSVVSIEKYENKKVVQKTMFIKSSFKIRDKSKIINELSFSNFRRYIDFAENFDGGYSKIFYNNGVKESEFFDRNHNSIFEEKIFYINGIIKEKLRDVDENSFFEITERYTDGKLKNILYKENEFSDLYYYKEEINANSVVKSWDTDRDGIYEISIEEYKNGILYKSIDIDRNGKYDYIYQIENSIPVKLFKIESGKMLLLKTYNTREKTEKTRWKIISGKDIALLDIPQDIEVTDLKKLNGYFIFNNQKYLFEDSILKSDNIHFRISILDNEIFLIDLSK